MYILNTNICFQPCHFQPLPPPPSPSISPSHFLSHTYTYIHKPSPSPFHFYHRFSRSSDHHHHHNFRPNHHLRQPSSSPSLFKSSNFLFHHIHTKTLKN
ncbi:hypothetical protein LguiA_020682 [Lonicera macranthoides]